MRKLLERYLLDIAIVLWFVGVMVWALLPAQKLVTTLDQPQVIMDVLDPSLDQYAAGWEEEIGRRFPHSVGVLCHGGDAVEGQWLCLPFGGPGGAEPIEWLIKREQQKYPDRTIVLLCCNVKHELMTGHPGVWYAPSSVWCQPDRAAIDAGTGAHYRFTLDGRSNAEPDDVGNIFEFNEMR